MKSSQLQSQLFIYILAMVLVSFILIFGYNSVQNFRDRAEKVSCLKFENELKSAIESISGDFGSVKRKDFQLCKSFQQVCFVDDNIIDRASPNAIDQENTPISVDPIIKDSIISETPGNVFLVSGVAKDSFYAGKISVQGDVLCIKTLNNKIVLRFEGEGNKALIGP